VSKITFVFFILHLSQAFHTRLCLPSEDEVWEWASWAGEEGWPCEVARFEVRCTVLTALEFECCFFGACGLR
jgi:hypothetical protein